MRFLKLDLEGKANTDDHTHWNASHEQRLSAFGSCICRRNIYLFYWLV